MAHSSQYDVVVIGCGIAGSVAGALLAEKARKKVLILEGSSQVGGRATSFRGEGIKDAASFRKTLGLSAHCWVHERSEPSLEEMIRIVENSLLYLKDLQQGDQVSILTGLPLSYASPANIVMLHTCLLYTSPSPRDRTRSRMPSSA